MGDRGLRGAISGHLSHWHGAWPALPSTMRSFKTGIQMKTEFLVTTTAVLAALGFAGCGSVQKAELDREVDRLCAIDGGVHVYEVVRLPKENFGPKGEVFPQYRHLPSNNGRFSSAYTIRRADKVLVAGNPAMERIDTLIVRLSDNKVLGERIIYRRSGGDMPGPAAASRHSCPEDGPDLDLEDQVFKPEEK